MTAELWTYQRVGWAAKPNIHQHNCRALGLSAQPTRL